MELPVVSTDVGDVSLYLEDYKNGFIVPVNAAKTMADRIRLLIGDESLRKNLGRSARSTVVEQLDIGLCAENHYQVYSQAFDQRERELS